MYDQPRLRPASYTATMLRMVQPRHRPRFAQETVALTVVAIGQHLDRDRAVEHHVVAAIDVGHPAAPDQRVDAIAAVERAAGERLVHANAPRCKRRVAALDRDDVEARGRLRRRDLKPVARDRAQRRALARVDGAEPPNRSDASARAFTSTKTTVSPSRAITSISPPGKRTLRPTMR